MKATVVGCGAVGARVARQLLATSTVTQIVLRDVSRDRLATVARALGEGAVAAEDDDDFPDGADVVVLASPAHSHLALARTAVHHRAAVVTLTDSIEDVQALLTLDHESLGRGVPVVIGAGFSPGLTCVLARYGAEPFDVVDEIHVAKAGTGGPACARQHHRALSGSSVDWRHRAWTRRRGGSGRELLWFPEPVAARDCYRAALAEALLLAPAFPSADRLTSRLSATRRDRLTAGLPMLSPPHAEGGVGAVRVELRGRRANVHETVVLGAAARPAVAAASVAAVAAAWALAGRLPPGASGLAPFVAARPFLAELMDRGLSVWAFDGRPRRGV